MELAAPLTVENSRHWSANNCYTNYCCCGAGGAGGQGSGEEPPAGLRHSGQQQEARQALANHPLLCFLLRSRHWRSRGGGGATRVLALPNPLGTPLSPPQLKKDKQKRNITEVFSFFLYDSDEGNSVRSTPPRRPVATLFENFLATPVGADLFFWPGSEVEV